MTCTNQESLVKILATDPFYLVSIRKTINLSQRADQQLSIRDTGGGDAEFVECICLQNFKLFSCFDDIGKAILAEAEDFVVIRPG